MKKIKVRFREIVADLYYNESLNNKKLIIFCSGIPGRWEYEQFAQKFVSRGFIFLHPKYTGSWESDGSFSVAGCKKSIEEVIIGTKKEIKDIFNNTVKIHFEKTFLMGHSFGGSLALVVGASNEIDGIISLAPIIDYREHNSNRTRPEENIVELFDYLQKGFKNIFRGLDKEDWLSFCKTGNSLNPVNFLNNLKNKNIFLAHGALDKSVDPLKTEKFYRLIKNDNLAVHFESAKADHSNIRDNSAKKIISWILKLK